MAEKLMKKSVWATVGKTLLRVIMYLLLLFLFFVIGLIIGYALIGKVNFWEVLSQDTWRHIIDLVMK